MQPSQVKEYFTVVERTIGSAAQLCQIRSAVPDQLRECVGQLDREATQAARMLAQEQNPNRIVDCINHLEKLGDRALHACAQGGNTVDEQVRTSVRRAHDAIADLKRRLH